MTSVFDGVAGVLNSVFGAPVVYLPAGGDASEIQSVFRNEPVEIEEEDGSVVMLSASWRVPADLAVGVARGDRIQPGNGKTYKILSRIPQGSPAPDGFVLFELEDVT